MAWSLTATAGLAMRTVTAPINANAMCWPTSATPSPICQKLSKRVNEMSRCLECRKRGRWCVWHGFALLRWAHTAFEFTMATLTIVCIAGFVGMVAGGIVVALWK